MRDAEKALSNFVQIKGVGYLLLITVRHTLLIKASRIIPDPSRHDNNAKGTMTANT